MKIVLLVILPAVFLVGIGFGLIKLPAAQDVVLDRGAVVMAERAREGLS